MNDIQLPAMSAVNRSSGASRRGSHRLSDIMTCERKWWLRYHARFVEVEDKGFRQAGTLIHQAIAWYYAAKMAEPPAWFKENTLEGLLEAQGRGQPALIRNALSCVKAYEAYWSRHPGGDPWIPKYIESEFETTVGAVDPSGPDELMRVATREADGTLSWDVRRLNDEVITCRPDLIVDVGNGRLFIIDHKTQRPQWGKKTLSPLKDGGEFRVSWQALFNLHVVRQSIPQVTGFQIQRINRDEPWDSDRLVLPTPALLYQDAPRVIRRLVRRELELGTALAQGEPAQPNPWSCMGRYGPCDYIEFCAADDLETQAKRLANDFVRLEEP